MSGKHGVLFFKHFFILQVMPHHLLKNKKFETALWNRIRVRILHEGYSRKKGYGWNSMCLGWEPLEGCSRVQNKFSSNFRRCYLYQSRLFDAELEAQKVMNINRLDGVRNTFMIVLKKPVSLNLHTCPGSCSFGCRGSLLAMPGNNLSTLNKML